MTSYNGQSITYDEIGNPLTYRDGMTMTWTGRQLRTLTQNGKQNTYKYDVDGLRLEKTAGGVTTQYQYVNGQLLGEKRSNGVILRYTYDALGVLSGIQYTNGGGTWHNYIVRCTLSGDADQIYDTKGNLLARYIYDTWGNTLSVTDASGKAITDPLHIASINPIRYRGYYYDAETGLYYVSSRYYDSKTYRWINADRYVSTGQGILGTNMFTYCGSNPVNNCDPSGQFFISAFLVGGLIIGCGLFLSGCSAKSEPKPEPYKSADDAARAFSEQVYSSSSYIRHEYSTEIYSRTVNGETTYNYNPPRAGKPHSASVGNSTPKGTQAVAYAHTHPNSNVFSRADIRVAEGLKIDAYVVGPNLELQRYSLSSASATNLGVISPVALTDAQRSSLVAEFQVSWDEHVSSGCDFGCDSKTWPTP